MNKYKFYIPLLILAALAIILTGCSMALNPIGSEIIQLTEPDTEIETGITITVPRYAPWITAAVANSSSRAFAFIDTVEIIITDSSDVEIYNDTFGGDPPDGSMEINCSANVIPGTGYSLIVNIYNNNVSITEPVVSGTVTGIDVIQGNTTSVTVTCVPVNPDIVEADTIYNFSTTPMVVDGNGDLTDTGGELWYSMTGPATGYLDFTVTVPEDIFFLWAAFAADGSFLNHNYYGDRVYGSQTISINANSGETCYLAVAMASSTSTPVDGSVSWTEMTPNYLTETDVPDPNLRAAFEDAVGKSFSQITDLDLEVLDGIYLEGEDFLYSDLTGIEYCSGLRFLGIESSSISDFSLLADLVNLEQLNINANNISDISFLPGLSSLRELDIRWNQISSIAPLSDLTNLETLYFEHNHIDDITPISMLSKMRFLALGDNLLDVTDLAILTSSNFPNLWGLRLDNIYAPDDLMPIDLNTELNALLDILDNLNNLAYLYMDDFYMDDSQFTALYNQVLAPRMLEWRELKILNSNLTDTSLSLISNLSNLKCLDLFANNITDLSAITGLINIRELYLAENEFTDLTPLQTMYDNGAFRDDGSWDELEIDIRNCNLYLSPGSANMAVIDYLIGNGVLVDYEDGNQLFAGPRSVSGTFDLSNLINAGFSVDSISISLMDSNTYDQIYLQYTSSDLSVDNTIEYVFSELDYTGDLWVSFSCSKNNPYLSPDNYSLWCPTQFPNFDTGSDASLDYTLPMPYTADGTVESHIIPDRVK